MAYELASSLARVAQALKAARWKKGLSQRVLSAKVGMPQSHISKIEHGAVDLQTSNLIELARALDLEVMLVPRPLVPAVDGLIRGALADIPTRSTPVSLPAQLLEQDEGDA